MKAIAELFRVCSWPHLKRHWLRWLLVLVSVMLAVVLFVSLRTLENSLLASFEKSTQILSGGADVCVTHGVDIEADALQRIEQIDGVVAAPVIEWTVTSPDLDERIMVVGIDFIRDAKLRGYSLERGGGLRRMAFLLPRRLIVSREFARKHHLRLNQTLRLQTAHGVQTFTIVGYFPQQAEIGHMSLPVMALNIRTAQYCFLGRGRYDRIDVRLDGATLEDLQKQLDADYRVQPLLQTNPVLSYQLQQFELLLNPITVLALLTAIFLIHNTLHLSVVERLGELAVLRAVGADRVQILLLIVGESLVVGAVAAALGVGLGIAASQYLLNHTAASASLLMQVVDVRELTVPTDALVLGALVGVLMAAVGAAVPAWLAFRVPPGEALSRFQPTQRPRLRLGLQLLVAAAVFMMASGSGRFFLVDRRSATFGLVLGYASAALAMPALVSGGSRLLSAIAARLLRIEGLLALDNIVSFPARTSLTVAAFSTSLSIVVAISGCLLSLERQISRFVERVTPYDLVLQTEDPTLGVSMSLTFPQAVKEEIARLPEVRAAQGVRNVLVPYHGEWVMLAAFDMPVLGQVIEGCEAGDLSSLLAKLERGGVAVSSSFAHFQDLGVGDTVELETPAGLRSFPILRVVEDYAWPRGTVLLDRDIYRRLWSNDTLNYLHVASRPGVSVDKLRRAVEKRLQGSYQVSVYPTAELRRNVSAMLGQWFRVADAQIIVAQVVGAMGIANTVLISLLSRRRQVALLVAIGASSWQICAALAWEATILGVWSALAGILLGLWQIWLPTRWVIEAETGYHMSPLVPWGALLSVCVLGVCIALLASLVPITFARRTDLKAALAYE